ncbi:MAG: EAL and HDOD domain-containing protein [Planctomycetota bacterium JB042]
MDALIGRQPICDAKQEVVGYELLYRSDNGVSARDVDGDQATASVTINALLDFGLDHLVGPQPAFVNLTRRFLLDRHWQSFPQDRVYLEILESVPEDDEVMAALHEAKDLGYRIALDDVVDPKHQSGILALADVVKVDFPQLDRDGLSRLVDDLARPGRRLLAEKVETPEQFDLCRGLGYDWFQGFFFCRPKVIRRRRVPTDRLSLLRLLARMQDPDLDIHEAREIIERNVALSYQMLRIVNSAMYSLPVAIESIQQAIVLLGLTRIRRYVALLLLSDIDDKPRELMHTALVRGRTCEMLASSRRLDTDSAFCVGLLSVLDALTDLPMDEALQSIRLAPPLESALRSREGELGDLLRAIDHCEGTETAPLPDGFAPRDVAEAFFGATRWAREVLAELAGFLPTATSPQD